MMLLILKRNKRLEDIPRTTAVTPINLFQNNFLRSEIPERLNFIEILIDLHQKSRGNSLAFRFSSTQSRKSPWYRYRWTPESSAENCMGLESGYLVASNFFLDSDPGKSRSIIWDDTGATVPRRRSPASRLYERCFCTDLRLYCPVEQFPVWVAGFSSE